SEMATLAQGTAPVIATRSSEGPGCQCVPTPGASDDTSGGSEPPSGVQVGAPVQLGTATAVVLDGASPDALLAWLASNGFAMPAAHAGLVTEYAKPGRYFVAIRRSPQAPVGVPTSVALHLTIPGDQRGLPLRFARMGASARVAFTV